MAPPPSYNELMNIQPSIISVPRTETETIPATAAVTYDANSSLVGVNYAIIRSDDTRIDARRSGGGVVRLISGWRSSGPRVGRHIHALCLVFVVAIALTLILDAYHS